jgi:CHAD domain-containing protein
MPPIPSPASSLSVASAAEEILRARLDQFQRRLRQAARKKNSEDPEAIHQLRVAARRGRAAIELFSQQILPEQQQQWFARVLRKARKAADGVRNLDVYRERITDSQSNGDVPPAVLKLIRRRRKESLPKVVAVDRKYRESKRLAKHQKKLLQGLRDTELADSFADFAAAALQPVRDDFLAQTRSRDASPEQLHRLRIAGKHLRYTVELLSEALPRKACESLLVALTMLQDALGAINDHATALELLAGLGKEADDAATARWLSQQKRAERAALKSAQAKFLQTWTLKERNRIQSLCERVLATRAKRKRQAGRTTSKRKRP